MTDKQQQQMTRLQSECDAFCLRFSKSQEASITVDGESLPGRCRFHMTLTHKAERYRQSAHVPMTMIELMPVVQMAVFVRELAAGAFGEDFMPREKS